MNPNGENEAPQCAAGWKFLAAWRMVITLVLTEDLARGDAGEVRIERNFLHRKDKIQRVDGQEKSDDGFEEALTDLLLPGRYGRKPTFRQIISHNIRYKDESVSNVLKTLDKYSRADEYETLFLFLLGCDFAQGEEKQTVRAKIELEEKFRRRLEAQQTKSGCAVTFGTCAQRSGTGTQKDRVRSLASPRKCSGVVGSPDGRSQTEATNQVYCALIASVLLVSWPGANRPSGSGRRCNFIGRDFDDKTVSFPWRNLSSA